MPEIDVNKIGQFIKNPNKYKRHINVQLVYLTLQQLILTGIVQLQY